MRVLISGLLLVLTTAASGQEPPWNDKGDLALSLYPIGEYVWRPLDPGFWRNDLINRFGQLPDIVIYDDLPAEAGFGANLSFWYKPYDVFTPLPGDSTWWQENITWGMLRPHLRAKFENTSTGTIQVLPLPADSLSFSIAWRDTGSYKKSFQHDISVLPISQNDVIYRLWIEPVTEPFPTEMFVDTLSFLRTTRSTPADTFFYMYRHWVEALTTDSDLAAKMLRHFPYDTRLLRHQFWRYYDDLNCDSVSYYGDALMDVWENRNTSYMGDLLSTFDKSKAIEDIETRIHDICVEGVAKPKTALGEGY